MASWIGNVGRAGALGTALLCSIGRHNNNDGTRPTTLLAINKPDDAIAKLHKPADLDSEILLEILGSDKDSKTKTEELLKLLENVSKPREIINPEFNLIKELVAQCLSDRMEPDDFRKILEALKNNNGLSGVTLGNARVDEDPKNPIATILYWALGKEEFTPEELGKTSKVIETLKRHGGFPVDVFDEEGEPSLFARIAGLGDGHLAFELFKKANPKLAELTLEIERGE